MVIVKKQLRVLCLVLGMAGAVPRLALAQPTAGDLKQAKKLFVEAEKKFKSKKYESAMEQYLSSYRLSNEPELLFNIGLCYFYLGQHKESIQYFSDFLSKIPPSFVSARKEAEEKIAESKQALDRQKAISFYEEAERHYALLEYEKALDNYKESYRLAPSPVLLYNIGQCQRKLKLYSDAKASYQGALRQFSPSEPLYAKTVEQLREVEVSLGTGGANTPGSGGISKTMLPGDALAPGEGDVVALPLEKVPASLQVMPGEPSPEDAPSHAYRWYGGTAIGLGVGSALVGGFFTFLRSQGNAPQIVRSAPALFVGGGVAITAGTSIWIVGNKRASTHTKR